MRIVIPIVAGIGNALLAVPMVRQIKRNLPDARVTILARIDAMGEPFRRLSEVDEVVVTGKSSLAMVKASRARKPDIYLVPFPSNRWQYSMLALTSGAKRAILHGHPTSRLRSLGFVGERVSAVRGIHDVVQNLRLLPSLGFQKPDFSEAPEFVLRDDDRERARALLEGAGSFVAVHAGSARTILAQAKRWPSGNYARLIDQIRQQTGLEVVLLEGPDEAGVADEIRSHTTQQCRVLKLTGPLGDAAAVLERSLCYVGTDSGLAHLAAAVGRRAVTIFAPADPDRVCPFGNRDLVVKPDKPCSPCFRYPWETPHPAMRCREPFCITEVTVEMVMDAVRRATSGSNVTRASRPCPQS